MQRLHFEIDWHWTFIWSLDITICKFLFDQCQWNYYLQNKQIFSPLLIYSKRMMILPKTWTVFIFLNYLQFQYILFFYILFQKIFVIQCKRNYLFQQLSLLKLLSYNLCHLTPAKLTVFSLERLFTDNQTSIICISREINYSTTQPNTQIALFQNYNYINYFTSKTSAISPIPQETLNINISCMARTNNFQQSYWQNNMFPWICHLAVTCIIIRVVSLFYLLIILHKPTFTPTTITWPIYLMCGKIVANLIKRLISTFEIWGRNLLSIN